VPEIDNSWLLRKLAEDRVYRRAKDAGTVSGEWFKDLVREDAWFRDVVPNVCSIGMFDKDRY
jgi:hypothetical protein